MAKRRLGPYGEEWLKIRNPHYTRMRGRREFFRERARAASARGPAGERQSTPDGLRAAPPFIAGYDRP